MMSNEDSELSELPIAYKFSTNTARCQNERAVANGPVHSWQCQFGVMLKSYRPKWKRWPCWSWLWPIRKENNENVEEISFASVRETMKQGRFLATSAPHRMCLVTDESRIFFTQRKKSIYSAEDLSGLRLRDLESENRVTPDGGYPGKQAK